MEFGRVRVQREMNSACHGIEFPRGKGGGGRAVKGCEEIGQHELWSGGGGEKLA